MHVPDGIVPLWLQIVLLVVSGAMLYVSFKVVSKRFNEKLVPYMGVLAAVIFAAQLVNFPVPPFSSGHLVGSTLLAVMTGPWVAMLIMALVTFVQALYGDGGILTWGLNFFNMGVFSPLLGYGLAVLFYRASIKTVRKERAVVVAASITSFIVTVSAAFTLGLQLLTVDGFGTEALIAITAIHFFIGIGEAVLTSIILLYFVKANPGMILLMSERKTIDSGDLSPDDKADGGESIADEIPVWRPKEIMVPVAASIILVVFAIMTGLASVNPDGFEWALFEFAGVPEPEVGYAGLWSFLAESSIADVFTGSIGILLLLGFAAIVFRRASHHHDTNPNTGKFLLPFGEGRRSPTPFSPPGMLLAAIAVSVLVALQYSISVVGVILILVLSGGVIAGTAWRRVISIATKFEIIILFWVLLMPFLYGSSLAFSLMTPLGPINAYSEGVLLGLLLGLRMLTILLVFLAALSHMTLTDFIGALRTFRVPQAILGSVLIMLRYVPLFMEERSRMQDAQILRGYEKGSGLGKLKAIGFLVGTTIDRAFDRSARVYDSMSLRGFGKGATLRISGFRRVDVLLPVMILLLVVAYAILIPNIIGAIFV
ncbi:MAG: energy-coupling factor ABC transporter permease [Candidatus Thorarchaeota archaeon]|nr:MAG: energy-coupling factor ABC transporter permease [Candidatus Thorarchaeota archaeon]